jgi:hypothetical protein
MGASGRGGGSSPHRGRLEVRDRGAAPLPLPPLPYTRLLTLAARLAGGSLCKSYFPHFAHAP